MLRTSQELLFVLEELAFELRDATAMRIGHLLHLGFHCCGERLRELPLLNTTNART